MYVVGIDENGYGPMMGPMVVTAAAFEVSDYSPQKLSALLASGARVDDSKAFLSHGSMEAGEVTALSFLTMQNSGLYETWRELGNDLFVEAPVRGPGCPSACNRMCWNPDERLPVFARSERIEEAKERLVDSLAGSESTFVRGSSVMLCTRDFNVLNQALGSKALLDLFLFESLILDMVEFLQSEALFLCGKVSGMKSYQKRLSLLPQADEVICEEPHRSAYRIPGIGIVEFVKSGDSIHPPTSLASVIGKYLRELSMKAINDFLSSVAGTRESVSGYRDSKTKRVMQSSRKRLEAAGVPMECMFRKG